MPSQQYDAHNHTNHPPRKQLRLEGYDYSSSGAYSVTICTKDRQPFFTIPILHQIAEAEWETLPLHFAGIAPDTLVVMPDHLHAILWINDEVKGSPTLIDAIRGYKSLVSVTWIRYLKQTGKKGPGHIWHRSFNDHIIRNERDLQEKQQYILNNPIKAELKNAQKRFDQQKGIS
jgi:putative transposase